MRILCSNDDGYLAIGIRTLAAAASRIGDVAVVAPDREQSATSHSLTMHHPLRVRHTEAGEHIVDGTPTDCVLMAIGALLDERPDVCLSGVNHGPNMGEDVLYSGTVAAAMEATVLGVPSIAFSYVGHDAETIPVWEDRVYGVLRSILGRGEFPEHTLFNVNLPPIPPDDVRGIRVTSLGKRRYSESIVRANDPNGREYYWIGGGEMTWSGSEYTDFGAIDKGYISVTPLHLDLTNYRLLEEIRAWDLTL